MDILNKILTLIDHERGKIIGTVLAVCVFAGVYGCESKTTIDDGKTKVTRTELHQKVVTLTTGYENQRKLILASVEQLNADIAAFNQKVTLAESDLDKQDAVKAQILTTLGGIGTAAATGGITAPVAIGSIMQLALLGFGAGAVVDQTRKNALIQTLQDKAA